MEFVNDWRICRDRNRLTTDELITASLDNEN